MMNMHATFRPGSVATRLFAAYDRVRVVSLPDRKDRRRLLERHLDQLGVERSSWAFHDAARPLLRGPFFKTGSHGAFWSHFMALNRAAMGNQSILLLQDDVVFLPVEVDLPAADVFYGGWHSHGPDPATAVLHGAHCMGFTAEAARMACDYLLTRYHEAQRTNQTLPPIDGLLVEFRRAHPRLTTEFRRISDQRPSRSDCTPGKLDRVPGLRALINVARRLKPVPVA